MSKHRKPGPGNKGDLLDELTSIQSLLGEGAEDVDQHLLSEDDIPLLPPDDEPEGDAHNQIPLLGGDAARSAEPAAGKNLHRELSERENPFLPKATLDQIKQSQAQTSKSIEKMIAQRSTTATSQPASPGAGTARPSLSDAEIRALVDEILASWMPGIERELRNRLIDELKNKS